MLRIGLIVQRAKGASAQGIALGSLQIKYFSLNGCGLCFSSLTGWKFLSIIIPGRCPGLLHF